jgi:hypothetical protein
MHSNNEPSNCQQIKSQNPKAEEEIEYNIDIITELKKHLPDFLLSEEDNSLDKEIKDLKKRQKELKDEINDIENEDSQSEEEDDEKSKKKENTKSKKKDKKLEKMKKELKTIEKKLKNFDKKSNYLQKRKIQCEAFKNIDQIFNFLLEFEFTHSSTLKELGYKYRDLMKVLKHTLDFLKKFSNDFIETSNDIMDRKIKVLEDKVKDIRSSIKNIKYNDIIDNKTKFNTNFTTIFSGLNKSDKDKTSFKFNNYSNSIKNNEIDLESYSKEISEIQEQIIDLKKSISIETFSITNNENTKIREQDNLNLLIQQTTNLKENKNQFILKSNSEKYTMIDEFKKKKESLVTKIYEIEKDHLTKTSELNKLNENQIAEAYKKFTDDLNKQNSEKIHYILLIDCSGSMNEKNKINYVKKGINNFIESVYESKDKDYCYISLISYNNTAEIIINDLKIDEIYGNDFVERLKAQNSTDFSKAFVKTLDIIPDNSTDRYVLVLFTDGEDDNPHESKEILKKIKMKNNKLSLYIIAYGDYFSETCENYMLELIQIINNAEKEGKIGYFKYYKNVSNYDQLLKYFNSLADGTKNISTKFEDLKRQYNSKNIEMIKLSENRKDLEIESYRKLIKELDFQIANIEAIQSGAEKNTNVEQNSSNDFMDKEIIILENHKLNIEKNLKENEESINLSKSNIEKYEESIKKLEERLKYLNQKVEDLKNQRDNFNKKFQEIKTNILENSYKFFEDQNEFLQFRTIENFEKFFNNIDIINSIFESLKEGSQKVLRWVEEKLLMVENIIRDRLQDTQIKFSNTLKSALENEKEKLKAIKSDDKININLSHVLIHHLKIKDEKEIDFINIIANDSKWKRIIENDKLDTDTIVIPDEVFHQSSVENDMNDLTFLKYESLGKENGLKKISMDIKNLREEIDDQKKNFGDAQEIKTLEKRLQDLESISYGMESHEFRSRNDVMKNISDFNQNIKKIEKEKLASRNKFLQLIRRSNEFLRNSKDNYEKDKKSELMTSIENEEWKVDIIEKTSKMKKLLALNN